MLVTSFSPFGGEIFFVFEVHLQGVADLPTVRDEDRQAEVDKFQEHQPPEDGNLNVEFAREGRLQYIRCGYRVVMWYAAPCEMEKLSYAPRLCEST